MKKRFTEAPIVGFLREADAGIPVKDFCRKHGFSEASYVLRPPALGAEQAVDAEDGSRVTAGLIRRRKGTAEVIFLGLK